MVRTAHLAVIDNQAVILDEKTNQYLGFNKTASFILKEIASGNSVDNIIAALLDMYDTELKALTRDVENLLGELCDMGIIRHVH